MCIHESSIRKPRKTVFIESLKLRNFATWNSVVKTSISFSFWTKIRWECVGYRSCVQVHFAQNGLSNDNEITKTRHIFSQFSRHPTIPVIIQLVKTTTIFLFVGTQFSILRESTPCHHYQLVPFPTCCLCMSFWHILSRSWFLLDNPLVSP